VLEFLRYIPSLNKCIRINEMIVQNMVAIRNTVSVISAGQARKVERLEQRIVISIPVIGAF